jgi:hypothetical protein
VRHPNSGYDAPRKLVLIPHFRRLARANGKFAEKRCSLQFKSPYMRFAFTLLLLTTGACVVPVGSTKFEKIATAFCDCTSKLADMSARVASEASDTTAHVSFQQNLLQLQEEYNSAKECAAVIKLQHGKLSREDLAKVGQALIQKCKNPQTQQDWLAELLGE